MLTETKGSPYLYGTYNRQKPIFKKGAGVWLFDTKGQRYLDFSAGIAVNALGHGHPQLVEALKNAADGIWHLSNLFEIPDQERLARRLCENSFADRVFMTNSGTEAIECAIKTARKHFAIKGQPERYKILTFEGAFHGRTLAAISAGGQQKYIDGFGPKLPGFEQIPFGNHELLDQIDFEEFAAVLVEPIQGEGGIREIPAGCLQGLRSRCDETGTLLIYDEIQTGIGRTGTLFSHDKSSAEPDIMAIAKGLGGGFPVGACLATEEAALGMVPGTHGTTFGGNPLAMSVANAVLDVVLSDGFFENVNRVSNQLKQGLSAISETYPQVFRSIRGSGLLLGLECVKPNLDFMDALLSQHLLTVPAGDNVLRLLPPLILTAEEASDALGRIEAAAKSLSSE